MNANLGEPGVSERNENRGGGATGTEHGNGPRAIRVRRSCGQHLEEPADIGVVADEASVLDPEGVHRTDALRQRR